MENAEIIKLAMEGLRMKISQKEAETKALEEKIVTLNKHKEMPSIHDGDNCCYHCSVFPGTPHLKHCPYRFGFL